jgi:hypothetical protein
MLSTDQKGAIAETAIAHLATRLSIPVWRPIAEGGRYDLILEVRDRLLRVQCKWATREGDTVAIRCYSCRRTRNGFVRRPYTPEEVDVFGAYCAELDRCFLLPLSIFGQRREIRLRLGPPRNNQRRGINWASDWEFEATLANGSLGP